MGINREHKDRLFKFIFQEKENLLQLYNALNGTDYDNSEELEIVTLEDIIYMRMKNDISFILDYQMNLFEHQSTENKNMPLRGLLYFARQYEKYVKERKLNLYGKKQILIPTPQYIVFYNGTEWKEERKVLKLSDAFANTKVKGCMELEALQLNINYGHNKDIMEKCKILWEYAAFVGKVRTYNEELDIEEAIDKAVDECIEQGILKEILISHQAEVKNMLLTEYDEEATMRLLRKEYQEDLEEAIKEAQEKIREEVQAEVRAELETEVRAELETEVRAELETEVRAELETEVRAELESEVRAEVEAEAKAEVQAELNQMRIEMEKMKRELERYQK